MKETFGVSMESPQSGWMSLRLSAGGREFVAVMSHRPYDSLTDLAVALSALLMKGRSSIVKWNAEPEEFDFEFEARGEEATLKVVRYRGDRRSKDNRAVVFSFRGSTLELCLTFRRELNDLKERGAVDGFEQNWRRMFPHSELQRLTKAVEAHGRKARLPSII